MFNKLLKRVFMVLVPDHKNIKNIGILSRNFIVDKLPLLR
jgi:hypothetical protein